MAEVKLSNVGGGGGGSASAQNIGTGSQVYVTGTSSPFDFRTLIGGTDITLTQNANDITIDFSGAGGPSAYLKLSGNAALDATLRLVADQANTDSPLRLSTTAVTNYGANNVTTNTAFGTGALTNITSGGFNTAYGYNSGFTISTGAENTLYGYAAGDSISTGSYNMAIGVNALQSNSTLSYNTAIGHSGLFALATSGTDNIALGYNVIPAMAAGSRNIGIGNNVLPNLNNVTNGNDNICIGSDSGRGQVQRGRSVMIGYNVGGPSGGTGRTGCVMIGYGNSQNSPYGDYNVYIGADETAQNSYGDANVFVGNGVQRGGGNNFSQGESVAIGYRAAESAPCLTRCTIIGSQAAQFVNATGVDNTIIGRRTAQNLSSGLGNTLVGTGTLGTNTTGNYNTILGFNNITTGTGSNYNTAIGSGNDFATFNTCCIIGHNETATANNQMRFGNATQTFGSVVGSVVTQNEIWEVYINGAAKNIMLGV